MKPPLTFVYGNCVFAHGLDDIWACFSVPTYSYAWLSSEDKRARFSQLLGALEAVEADIQILRVSGAPKRPSRVSAAGDGGPDEALLRRYEELGHDRHRRLGPARPAVYMCVSLRDPERDVASFLSNALAHEPCEWRELLGRVLAGGHNRVLGAADLERARVKADQAHARLAAYLPVRPARGVELQWLVRRAFCRSLGEVVVDGLHEPRALAFERNGQALLAPLEADVLRWMDGWVEHHGRSLRVESELGTSWQAHLVLGALPDRVRFPGPRAELMFAPIESLPFDVDLTFNARFLPNELALRIARRRVQDADQIARAESDGEQGVSDLGYQRTQEARDLLAHLQASSRPPLLRATIALAVAAPDERTLEQRVDACRRAYGEVRLHRPVGDQLQLFMQHLPAQRARVRGYDDALTPEQVASMMPLATHHAGSSSGFHLGRTLSGSGRPVLFNLKEGSESDRNTAILSVGALGSGKTTLAQKLKYEAFLQGALVVDVDPKGDHRFHTLDEVAPHAHCVQLRPDPALRGVLDPLLVAPAHLRQDVAISFLRALLPSRAEPAWETAVVAAVDRVMRTSRTPTCAEVVKALQAGDDTDAHVGKALDVYARSGLTQLGFAEAPVIECAPSKQVTYISIRDLPGAEPSTPRSHYTQAERVGEQLVRLIAMYAAHLMASERNRLKVFSFDEGWRLLSDPVGRGLLASLQRMGRSELAVPIVSTQLVSDISIGDHASLENLLGATFVFGMRSESEAKRSLTLLGLDPDDRSLRTALLEFAAGRCLFKDHQGRVEAIQVELLAPKLLAALSTTPAFPPPPSS